jgi:hypothetical protein
MIEDRKIGHGLAESTGFQCISIGLGKYGFLKKNLNELLKLT